MNGSPPVRGGLGVEDKPVDGVLHHVPDAHPNNPHHYSRGRVQPSPLYRLVHGRAHERDPDQHDDPPRRPREELEHVALEESERLLARHGRMHPLVVPGPQLADLPDDGLGEVDVKLALSPQLPGAALACLIISWRGPREHRDLVLLKDAPCRFAMLVPTPGTAHAVADVMPEPLEKQLLPARVHPHELRDVVDAAVHNHKLLPAPHPLFNLGESAGGHLPHLPMGW
mmetsp:Transcript_69108/g.218591  ORF Transcript_69108/g.218591 Transcript_69108/m.218591 type:complete len:227 (+) Transcript_69108:2112-2792(+)